MLSIIRIVFSSVSMRLTDGHINHQMVQSLLLLHLTITRAFVTNYKMTHSQSLKSNTEEKNVTLNDFINFLIRTLQFVIFFLFVLLFLEQFYS